MARNAEALEKLAEQVQVVADETTDRQCRRDLRFVALGYERLAENARARRSIKGRNPALLSSLSKSAFLPWRSSANSAGAREPLCAFGSSLRNCLPLLGRTSAERCGSH